MPNRWRSAVAGRSITTPSAVRWTRSWPGTTCCVPGLPLVDGTFRAVTDQPGLVGLAEPYAAATPGHAFGLAAEFAARPIDLAAGPPIRAAIWRIADDDHLIVVVVHHVAWDGQSAVIFEREFADGYRNLVAGGVPGGVPAHRAGQAADQERPGQNEVAAWLGHAPRAPVPGACTPARPGLPGVPPRSGCRTIGRAASRGWLGSVVTRRLDQVTTGALARLAAEQGATLPMAALALFGAVLHGGQARTASCLAARCSPPPLPKTPPS